MGLHTKSEYRRLYLLQGGKCAACRRQSTSRLHRDHDHATGKLRGLLCRSCNLAAGIMSDDPGSIRRLARYLDRWETDSVPVEDENVRPEDVIQVLDALAVHSSIEQKRAIRQAKGRITMAYSDKAIDEAAIAESKEVQLKIEAASWVVATYPDRPVVVLVAEAKQAAPVRTLPYLTEALRQLGGKVIVTSKGYGYVLR